METLEKVSYCAFLKQVIDEFLFLSGSTTVEMSGATVNVTASDGGAVSLGNAQSKK